MNKRTKRLTEENEILCGELSTEAKEVLRNVTGYIQRFGISRYEQEKVRQDIAEMILEGEKRGIPVSETIGDDYQAFCDSVLAEMPRMTGREKLLEEDSQENRPVSSTCGSHGGVLPRECEKTSAAAVPR